MRNAIFLLAFTIIAGMLTGCQTTKARTDQISTLNNRIMTLEATLDQRDREISDLQYQLDSVSAKKAAKTPAVTATPETKDSLGIIRVNAPITDVQKALKSAGYYQGNIDGKIGPNTIAAIAAFQKANNLKADSIVGAKTWEILKTYLK
ncbi:MAG TPA: peptidoglycan-binding protein [Candidatus Omnitrophota bacterium]|nr:peptidoglycan-binding protein [Candidatus Omnitrophota bacterium]HQL41119.1 peptidoglycan-binding protein [Candidatus Omnitrophota bacterium]